MTIEELGRRAVACKHWRWMPGMRWWTEEDRCRLDDYQPEYMGRPSDALPDLADPATLGCLLALVEEAWKCPVDFSFDGAHWTDLITAEQVWVRDGDHPFEAKTRAGALVAALEAAP